MDTITTARPTNTAFPARTPRELRTAQGVDAARAGAAAKSATYRAAAANPFAILPAADDFPF